MFVGVGGNCLSPLPHLGGEEGAFLPLWTPTSVGLRVGRISPATGFCLTKRWLDEDTLDRVYSQYANDDGIDLQQFGRLADDGLLLEGKLDELPD